MKDLTLFIHQAITVRSNAMKIKDELLNQEEINGLLKDNRGDNMSAAQEDEYKDMVIRGDFKKILKEYLLHNYVTNPSLLNSELRNEISDIIGMEAQIILNDIVIEFLEQCIKKPF